jgi:hypothetical protein
LVVEIFVNIPYQGTVQLEDIRLYERNSRQIGKTGAYIIQGDQKILAFVKGNEFQQGLGAGGHGFKYFQNDMVVIYPRLFGLA